MLRAFLSVIIGYAAIVFVLMILATAAWMVMGPGTAFREGTTEVSLPWVTAMIVIGFVAAVAGGLVTARLARGTRAYLVLAGFLLVFGMALAVTSLAQDGRARAEARLEELGKPIEELGPMEAGQVAISPRWYNFVVPVVGFAGVVLGAGLRKTS